MFLFVWIIVLLERTCRVIEYLFPVHILLQHGQESLLWSVGLSKLVCVLELSLEESAVPAYALLVWASYRPYRERGASLFLAGPSELSAPTESAVPAFSLLVPASVCDMCDTSSTESAVPA